MQEYILLGPLIIKLTALLGAAFLVERFLVFMSEGINRLFVFQYSKKNTQIEKLQEKLKREEAAGAEEQAILSQDETDEDPREIIPNPNAAGSARVDSNFDVQKIVPIESILDDEKRYEKYKEQNTVRKEFWLQILGTLVAIVACYYSDFSIWVFITFIAENADSLDDVTIRNWEYVFTGILIGSGSKPINFLMNFLMNRRIEAVQDEVQAEARTVEDGIEKKPSETEPAELPPATLEIQPPSVEELVGFEYDGGDRPNRLEHTHLYRKPVDLIIYHHTAMHSDAPFEEVVKEFDRKGWLTGYHCIVFKDGAIRVLCRWDRFGNHAKPYNSHSMGIALQGNFEPNASVPFSNPDGRFGIMEPTHKQVQSAARVVALCAQLHGIRAHFPTSTNGAGSVKDILPHYMVASKACPGGNFPHEEFRESVKNYYSAWETDEGHKTALKAFKKRAMVMPEFS